MTLWTFNLSAKNVFHLNQCSSFSCHAVASTRSATVQKFRSTPASIEGVTRSASFHVTLQVERETRNSGSRKAPHQTQRGAAGLILH